MSIKFLSKIVSTRTRQFLFISLFLLIATFFFYINLKMPLAGEDYTLQPWGYNSAPVSFLEKVHAIYQQVIFSAFFWSPRIGEALTTITAVFPKIVFDFLNTILFLWLIIALFVIGFGRFPNCKISSDSFTILSIFFLFIVLFPLLGQLFFWKAGTCNHIWGLEILLSFTLPFRMNFYKRVRIKNLLFLLLYIFLGFFAGLTVENASAAILGSLLIYFTISRKQKSIDLNFIFPLMSCTAGVFFLLFSPGTTVRRNYYDSLGLDGNLTGIALYLHRFIRITGDFLKISWPLLIVFVVCILIYFVINWQNKKVIDSRINYQEEPNKLTISAIFILLSVSFLSVMSLISIAYQSDQRRGFAFFWLILICFSAFFLTEIWIQLSSKFIRSLLVIALLGILLITMVNTGMVYRKLYAENNIRMEIIYSALENGQKKIVIPAFSIQDSRIIETRAMLPDSGDRIAKYYGLESVEIKK